MFLNFANVSSAKKIILIFASGFMRQKRKLLFQNGVTVNKKCLFNFPCLRQFDLKRLRYKPSDLCHFFLAARVTSFHVEFSLTVSDVRV